MDATSAFLQHVSIAEHLSGSSLQRTSVLSLELLQFLLGYSLPTHKSVRVPNAWCLLYFASMLTEGNSCWRFMATEQVSSTVPGIFTPAWLSGANLCGSSQTLFKCSDKQCINRVFVCDGVRDCSNDEDSARCGSNPCKNKPTCRSGRCVAADFCCSQLVDPACKTWHPHECCFEDPAFLPKVVRPQIVEIPSSTAPIPVDEYSVQEGLRSAVFVVSGCTVAFVFLVLLGSFILAKYVMRRLKRRRLSLESSQVSHTAAHRQASSSDQSRISNLRPNCGSNNFVSLSQLWSGRGGGALPSPYIADTLVPGVLPPPYSEIVRDDVGCTVQFEDLPPPYSELEVNDAAPIIARGSETVNDVPCATSIVDEGQLLLRKFDDTDVVHV